VRLAPTLATLSNFERCSGAVTSMSTTAGQRIFQTRRSCNAARHGRRGLGIPWLLLCLATTTASLAQVNDEGPSSAVDNPSASTPTPRTPTARRAKADSAKDAKKEQTEAKTRGSKRATQTESSASAASVQIGPPRPPDDADVATAEATPAVSAAATALSVASSPAATAAAPASAVVEVATAPASGAAVAAEGTKRYDVAEVKIRDVLILRLKLEDGGLVPAERAKRATRAIQAALEDANPGTARTEARQDRALLFVGSRPIVELTRADADAIGEGSLDLFAASAAAKVNDVLESERQRSRVSRSALSIAVVVASALAVLYVLRLFAMLARKLREFVHLHPERIPAIHLRSIEVVGPHVLRSGIVVGVGVVKLLMQFGLIFAWLLFSLSLFDATRSMTGKLTALITTPLSALATRFAALLPLLLLTTIGTVVLVVLLRFVALFFGGVERRETELHWLRPELAAPTSLLIRIGLVVVSLLLFAPLVTGNVDGSLARVGMLALVAIAAATTPLAANIVVGLVTLYGGRLKLGDAVRIGEHSGVLSAVDLIELHLTTDRGRQLRVPHLVTLVRPLVVAGTDTFAEHRLRVTAEARFDQLLEIFGTAQVFSHPAAVRLVKIEGTLTSVELTPRRFDATVEQQLLVEVARELAAKQLRLVLAEWQPSA